MKRLRSLLPHLGALFAVIAVGGLALLLDGAAIAPAKAALPDAVASLALDAALPTYPGAVRYPVGRQMVVNGQRMNLDVAYTETADLYAIAEHYQNALRDAGLEPRLSTSDEGVRVSAVSPDGRQYAVDIEPFQQGAVILPAVSRGVLQVGAGAKEIGLPVPEKHAALLQSTAQDGNRLSKNVQFVAALPLPGLFTFYRDALARDGWFPANEPLKDDRLERIQMQNFRRDDHSLRLSARDMEEGGSMVYLLEEWTAAPPEETP